MGRRNIATEAARAILRYGFEEIGPSRIYAGADPPNVASSRVMEKLKMKFARKTSVDGREAFYYAIAREKYHPEDLEYRLSEN